MPLETSYFFFDRRSILLMKNFGLIERKGEREMSTEFSFSTSPGNRMAAVVDRTVNGQKRCGLISAGLG